jgi:glycosyltransferase involved in cell wall biosynthesis
MSPFEAAVLNVCDSDFSSVAATVEVDLQPRSPVAAESSEAEAAVFLTGFLRQSKRLRRRFPRALSEGETGRFARWLQTNGEKDLGLSALARKKIRGAFRRPPGKRITDIYLNDPELQRLYPLGLLPVGQMTFLAWLTTSGRKEYNLADQQILWFLHETAEDHLKGWCLTYLLQPSWQKSFPLALTTKGWPEFRRWLVMSYGRSFTNALPRSVPLALSTLQWELRKDLKHSLARGARLEGVNMLSHFCTPMGIQQAALWAKTALECAGLRTSCRDVPLPRRTIPTNRANWLGREIFPITILNHAATPYFVRGYERSGLHRRDDVYRIAYWNWELETVPDEWVEAALLVDEIWSPTQFVAKAMRSRMPRPVYHMLPGVEIGDIAPIDRTSLHIPEDHFIFLFMFDLYSQLHRKNPLGLIRAFRQAFREDDATTLVIKTSGGDVFPADLAQLEAAAPGKNILILDQAMPRAAAYGLIAMGDCFVSLHRSEGFGLGLAEAMLMGKPVVATGYSGNLDFMNHDNSILIDYKIVDITDERPIYAKGNFWAEPSIEHAAASMRRVYENREEARGRAIRAQPAVKSQLSLHSAGERMRARLEQIGDGIDS